MNQQPPNAKLGFQVLPQQQRELSVNLSVVSDVYQNIRSYEQLLAFFKQLVSHKIDMQQIHNSPRLKLKKYKEAVYYGEFVEGRREGKGVMLYHSGQRYEGDWKADQRHGQGFEIFSNGSTYEGEYYQNKMQGQGKYVWPGGQIYEGQWTNNLKNGTGAWTNERGDSYVGEWKQGNATGFGVYNEENSSRYEGLFKNFIKCGKGIEKFISGDLYQGSYSEGKFHGQGQYYWKDGSFYKGDFKNGLKNGYGVLKNALSGDKYEGEFIDNRKQGYGIYTWGCGDIYKGHYLANLRHGTGEMYWSDGTVYKGSWMVDKFNGKGTLFDGEELIKGIFKDGELVEIDNPHDQQHKGISQFYLDPLRPHKRVIVTPIRKITEDPIDRFNNNRRLILSQVDRDSEVRQIKHSKNNKNNKRVSPLIKESFLKKKLMKTIRMEPIKRIEQQTQEVTRTVASKSQSREKVLHSSLQVHRMFRNRQNFNINNDMNSYETVDNAESFAFSGNGRGERNRYYSRID